jgi:S-adenosylmethionine:tRNA ribosyltransferase-isomerase
MHMADHAMHAEQFTVSVALLESLLQALQAGKKVVAVGTTSMRTLESLYWIALQLKQQDEHFTYLSQWTAYDEAPGQFSSIDAVEILLEYLRKEQSTSLNCATQIIIAPGYTFRFVDQLITNFHQPKSTLLLLIAAFVGIDQWPKIYDHALNSSYRFLSYGDSSLLIR